MVNMKWNPIFLHPPAMLVALRPMSVSDAYRGRSRSSLRALIVLVLALLIVGSLSACGQRGPLYLPDGSQNARDGKAVR